MPVIEDVISEGLLTLTFPKGALASKYDDWSHYRNQFNQAFGGTKAVDVVYAEPDVAWLIEVKDYRIHRRTKTIDLAGEVALKVRDTLAGLVAAKLMANDADEKFVATALLSKPRIRVVLHLESPKNRSPLYPQEAIDPSKVLMRLKPLVKAIDPHPRVVHQTSLTPEMNWTVAG
jgi:hypothetical protein